MNPTRPTRLRVLPRLLTVLGILALCTGASSRSCSFGSSDNDDDNDGDGGDNPNFVTTLELRDSSGNAATSFERDELIQMVLTVRNRSDETQTLTFPTGRQSDFLVVRAGTDDIVWQLSDGEAAPSQTSSTLEFAPDQEITVPVTWNQIDSDGDGVRVGAYEARGVLIFDGFDSNPLRASQLGSSLQRFTID